MIKYYSTLNEKLFDKEYDAQKAEDEFVKHYFEELETKAACERRKRNHIVDKTVDINIYKIKID